MAQKFCSNCGVAVNEGASFCSSCGQALDNSQQSQYQQPQYQQPMYQQPMYQQPMYQPPMYGPVAPIRPGRGLGIASLVLGIIGLFYSFIILINSANYADSYLRLFSTFNSSFILVILMFSSMSILALAFGAASRRKGYTNGISISGVILGIHGVLFYFISFILIATA